MVKSNQSVIIIDNSPYCVNDNRKGVMLPFYGSSSFVNDTLFIEKNGMEIEGEIGEQEKVKRLCEMIQRGEEEESEEMVTKIEELGENYEFFVQIM